MSGRTQSVLSFLMALAISAIVPLVLGAEASPFRGRSQSSPLAAPISITDTRTEGVSQPIGIEEAAPRFSWRYEASSQAPRGFRQSAYWIQVASSLRTLAQGQSDLWDSGRREGCDTLAVFYAGKPLKSATRYFWQVTGFDAAGQSFVARPQFFETGLLKAEDCHGAQWIAARTERPRTSPARLQALTDYSFQTRFRILEGNAVVLFRTTYAWGKGYGIEIQPGSPGRLVVTSDPQQKNPRSLRETTARRAW